MLEGGFDRIGLPLEGSDRATQYLLKPNDGFYENTLKLMESVGDTNIGLKVNTVVTQANVGEVLAVGEMLRDYRVSQWSVFQFIPAGRGKQYRATLEISDAEFGTIEQEIQQRKYPFKVKTSWKQKDGTFFVVSPQGIAYAVIEGKNVPFGNLITDDVETVLARHPLLCKKYEEAV